jgi:UPF0755 protein
MVKLFKKIIFLLLAAILIFWFYARVTSTTLPSGGSARLSPAGRLIDRLLGRAPAPEPIIPATEIIIQVPEGWTNDEIAKRLEKTGGWPTADFLKAAEGQEGYLFPDTYRVYASATPAAIVKKMLDNFDAKLTPSLRADINKQGKTIKDIVIMASIIEKEAGIDYGQGADSDARIISGIFWNRLKIGQGLQSDVTVAYALKDNNFKNSNLDLNVDSPYNTYKYRGLPPGPIANPGLIAIQAAITPLATNYYYFLTTPDHKIIYAKTYEEHLQNKYKYLK